MASSTLPPNKVFMHLSRRTPHSDNYEMTVAIQLEGYSVKEFNPNQMRYERRGGVNYRHTEMVLQPDETNSELYVKSFPVTAARKDEDAIHVELRVPSGYGSVSTDTAKQTQAQQRSPGVAETESTSGGTTGTYEP